jgi:hypothetical protein
MATSNGTTHGTQGETPLARAQRLLKATPLIDGHNDFPFLLRQQLHNQIYEHDLRDNLDCHTSLEKMRKGMMGGQFWSIYVPNPEEMRLEMPSENGSNDHECGCEHTGPGKTRALGLNEPNVSRPPVPLESVLSLQWVPKKLTLTCMSIVGRPRHTRTDRHHAPPHHSISILLEAVHYLRCCS